MRINKYPDGTSYVLTPQVSDEVEFLHQMRGTVEFTYRINTYEDLWHLNQIVDGWNSQGVVPQVTIPCLIDAQADRRFEVGQSHGLKLVCEFLNNMDAHFIIFHPHNKEVVEVLMNNVSFIDNKTFIRKVFGELCDIGKSGDVSMWGDKLSNHLVLLSPDAGAFKWLGKLADDIQFEGEVLSASKVRSAKYGGKSMRQQLPIEDFGGKDVLIMDDLCIYGGTFKGLSTLLDGANVGKKYLAVSHITMQNLGEDPVTNYFDKVFTTNSKYDEYRSNTAGRIDLLNNLEVFKMFYEVEKR